MTTQKHPIGQRQLEAKPFPEMLSVITDPNLEVFQVTTDLSLTGNTRGGFFSPNSRYFFFRRGPVNQEWSAQWVLCDLEDSFALRTLSNNPGGAVVSPDSRYFYQVAGVGAGESGHLELRRTDLTNFRCETVAVFDAPVEGIGLRPNGCLSLSLRADGNMLCAGLSFHNTHPRDSYCNNGQHFAPAFIDLRTLAIRGFEWTPWSWRVGGFYFPGTDPRYMDRLLIDRHSAGQYWEPDGTKHEKFFGYDAQHVVDESGNIHGTLPLGHDPREGEASHTYWRGANYELVAHMGLFDSAPHWRGTILCMAPVDCPPEHYALGRNIPGACRVDLTRKFVRPDVCHMDWHVSGKYGVCDTEGWAGRGTPCLQGPAAFLYLATYIDDGNEDPYVVTKYLLHPRSSWHHATTENCQVLSPDLKTVFFNSDWTCQFGQPQVFAVRGFQFQEK
jgi:hypothetical protein